MAIVIYNCKRCKTGRRVEYPDASPRYRGTYTRTTEGGAVHTPGAWFSSWGGGRPPVREGDPLGFCRTCERPMHWGYLQAATRDDVRCDARCTHARGHSCECSCGGKNHGAHW